MSRSEVCPRAPADVDGQPWCNSHYTRQLWVWATVMALSQQRWDASWDGQGVDVDGVAVGSGGAGTMHRSNEESSSASAGKVRGLVKGSLTLTCVMGVPKRLPVLVKDAILHWEPDTSGGKIVVAAGTLRVQRIRVEEPGGGVAGGGGEGSDLPDFRLIAECVGRWVIPAGGVLVLKVCQLASEPTGLEKMSASVQS